jgi:hypothetical protein
MGILKDSRDKLPDFQEFSRQSASAISDKVYVNPWPLILPLYRIRRYLIAKLLIWKAISG